jgi:hypothetical protein
MELVKGRTLEADLAERGPLPADAKTVVLTEVSESSRRQSDACPSAMADGMPSTINCHFQLRQLEAVEAY